MTLEEQIELFSQKLVTKNNLPSWFTRSIKDLISKNVTIEEWNTFTQYISNNASDIKSIEEFVLILADYLEECCTKEYVDNKIYGNSISLSGANGTLTDEQLSILTNYKDPVIYYTDSLGVVFTLQLKQKYQNEYTFTLDVSTMVSNYVSVIKYNIKVFTNTKFWVFETSNKNVVTKAYADDKFETKEDAFSGDYDDLNNKPNIPDAVSGTNDGVNWTALTIGNTTKAIPSGGSNYTGGAGIDITNNVIAVDNTVALKIDLNSKVDKSETKFNTNFEFVSPVEEVDGYDIHAKQTDSSGNIRYGGLNLNLNENKLASATVSNGNVTNEAIVKTTDDGTIQLCAKDGLGGSMILKVSPNGIAYSTDNGYTWTSLI